MKIKILLISILLLFFFNGLYADAVSSNLSYLHSNEKIWNLAPSEFQHTINENETPSLGSGNLNICFHFEESVNLSSDVEIYINDKEIKQLSRMGKYFHGQDKYAINITNFLREGRNTIELYYYNGTEKTEVHKWVINIGEVSSYQKQNDPFPLTTDSQGWKKMFSLSPNSKFIAYVYESNDQKQNSIKIFNLVTKTISNVIVSKKAKKQFGKSEEKKKFYSYAPCWSRDGRYLFFISTKSGHFELWRSRISFNGEVSDLTQLTNYEAYTSSPVISPDGKLFFVSNKDGDLQLYYSSNSIKAHNKMIFMNSVERFTTDIATIFAPAISQNGKYIAYCKEKTFGNSKVYIEISSISDKRIINKIKIENKDCLYPSWMPQKEIVSFYAGKSIYVANILQNIAPVKVASKCRLPSYAISPSWSDDAIYYVKDDKNKSIDKILVAYKNLGKSKSFSVLNNRKYRDNMEVQVTNNHKYIIYNSFNSGNWELWAIPLSSGNALSCVDFSLPPLCRISFFEPQEDKFKLIGFSPFLESGKNVTFEKENIPVGFHRFKFNNKEMSFNTSLRTPYDVTLPQYEESPQFSNALHSLFLPGWGQSVANNDKKGKFFLYSALGLATLGGGSYFLQEKYYNKYNDSSTIKSIEKNKMEYSSLSGFTNGIIIGGSLIYALNIIDALVSKPNIYKHDRIRFSEVYREIKRQNPQKRMMYGKKNEGFGELKVFSTVPYTEIRLKSYETKNNKDVYYGKTGYTFDTNTYFTIKDIPPGQYELICKKPFMKTNKQDITINEFKVNYSIVKMESNFGLKMQQFFYNSVPGLAQMRNGKYIKGGTILGICSISLAGVFINQAKANNDFDRYNNATNLPEIIRSKSDYSTHISLRNSFWVTFGLSLIYNLYDTYTGVK